MRNCAKASVRSLLALAVAAAVLTLAGTAGASLYQLGNSGWSVAVNSEWEISFFVEQLTERTVTIEIQKRFLGEPDEFGLMPAMYVEFIKNSEAAVGQIIITDEYIVNDTSEDWIDFHMELGVIGSPLAGFSQCIPSGDQFETVTLSGSDGYLGLPTRIDFCDGLVPNDPPGEDNFRPGYAYGAMVIVTNPEMQVGQRIFLKEYPTIPEPATLLVLALGALGFATARKK